MDETFGLSAHADFESLTRWLEQEPRVSTVLLRLEDRIPAPELLTRLREIPAVAGVSSGRHAIKQMEAQSGEMNTVFGMILSLFAASITVGVVYNMAKAALASRARDLASLRVLGFHRAEVAQTLGGEIVAIVTMALPLGMLMGRYVMLPALMLSADPEMYRLPIIVSGHTLLFSAAVTVAATVAGFLLVNRELKRLDPISALKTRE